MKYLILIFLVSNLWADNSKESLLNIKSTPEWYNVILTSYCSCQRCCSWKYNEKGEPIFNYGSLKGKKKIVGKTASGKIAKQGVTLAMPKEYPFGSIVMLNGKELGVCQDRGGAIIAKEGKVKIDVYFDNHQDALEFGVKKVFVKEIYLPDMDATKTIRTVK